MPLPKVAFLIIAHEAAEQLGRLVQRLDLPWARTFVHVDKKVDIFPFRTAVSNAAACHFLPDSQRVKTYWGGFSLVLATLNLLRFAINNTSDAQRLCILSGVDYPIKSMNKIAEALAGDEQFMRVDRKLDPFGNSLYDRRAYRFSFGDNHYFNYRLEMPSIVKHLHLRRLVSWIEDCTWTRSFTQPIYMGSQWWSLTREAAEELLSIFDKKTDRLNWFRYTNCSDEMVFQTFLKSTRFAEQISCDLTLDRTSNIPSVHGIHYIDWSKSDPISPRILELKDLPALRASPALFARKFCPIRSSKLMEALDRVNA